MNDLLGELFKNKTILTRLIYCVAAALVIHAAIPTLCETLRVELPAQLRPWMEEDKIKAVAIIAGGLFLLSLVLIPPEEEEKAPESEEVFDF